MERGDEDLIEKRKSGADERRHRSLHAIDETKALRVAEEAAEPLPLDKLLRGPDRGGSRRRRGHPHTAVCWQPARLAK